MTRPCHDRTDAGQVTLPLLIGVALVATAMIGVLAVTGRLLVDRQTAQAAADAAALAGVMAGEPAAAAAATHNGAELVDYGRRGQRVTVTVRTGWMAASASAEARRAENSRRSGLSLPSEP